MSDAIRRHRRSVAMLILTAVLTLLPASQGLALTDGPSASGTTTTTTTTDRKPACAIDWRKGTWYVKKLIRCAARHHGVSVDKALAIAKRESNFRPKAYNSWSCAKGLFQHLCRYWPGRAEAFGFEGWSAFNARANTFVTMKMVKRYGWAPWGG